MSGGHGGVSVYLKLPDKIDVPGGHTIIIGARQAPGQSQGFGIVGNIQGSIAIIVPYPGQYATLDFIPTNANAGEPVNLSGTINNLGNEAVNGSLWIDIYSNETKVKTLSLGNFDLASPDKQDFFTTFDTKGVASGTYRAVANFLYGDSHLAQQTVNFRLGELKVVLTNYTDEFERNRINRMQIEVESMWNDPIENVYANVSIIGYPMQVITPPISIEGFDKGYLTGFFDTTGIVNDSFKAKISIQYAGKQTAQIVTLHFKQQKSYFTTGLIIAIAIVVILIIVVGILIRRHKPKKKK
jgi:hypothetical protein